MKAYIPTNFSYLKVIEFDSLTNLNQISDQFLKDLCILLDEAEENNQIKVVLLYGGTRSFSAGSEIEEMLKKEPCYIYNDSRFKSWKTINRFSKILISSVSRMCAGSGFELALCSDEIISSDTATFSSPETSLGLIPGAGAILKLNNTLNRFEAFRFLTSNNEYTAQFLFEKNLISAIYSEDDLLECSLNYCKKFENIDINALKFLKASLRNYESDGVSNLERAFFSLLHTNINTREKLDKYPKL